MLGVEDWAEIRRLHLAEGWSIKRITRERGFARNTVRGWPLIAPVTTAHIFGDSVCC